MYHFWVGDVNLAPFLQFFAFAVLFPVQLLLCFKVRSRLLRLIPGILFSFLTVTAIIAAALCTGGDIALFIVSAFYLGLMLLVCAAAWGVWAAARAVKPNKGKGSVSK